MLKTKEIATLFTIVAALVTATTARAKANEYTRMAEEAEAALESLAAIPGGKRGRWCRWW